MPAIPTSAKLTRDEARQIRGLAAARTMSQEKIARLYGISRGVVKDIHLGKTWKEHDNGKGQSTTVQEEQRS